MGASHVALIRGINVGRARRVAMADLRALVGDLGYREVRTLLNSGNVVFTVPPGSKGEAASRIQTAMASRLGVPARVIVLTAAQLRRTVEENPLREQAGDPSRLLVAVPRSPGDLGRLRSLARQEWSPEAFALGKQAAYLWCAEGILESRLLQAVSREMGDDVTTRNLSTMTKLAALAGPER